MKRLFGTSPTALLLLTAREQEGPTERLDDDLDHATRQLQDSARDASGTR